MNRSGVALRPLLDAPEFTPSRDLLVLVDDLALLLGRFRLRARGSAGGHNGLTSVEDALQSQDYARLRIGIGPVPEGEEEQTEWVLQPFERHELRTLANLLPELADAVECWLDEGIDTAMNRFNRRGLDRE
jgi:PTH1 family peptidyl-tRNA hydrolase